MPRTVVEIPQEVKEQMIRDNRRMPYQQVAKIYGVGRNKCFEIVRGTCPRKKRTPKLNERGVNALCEDYINGLSPKKLAVKYGISLQHVYRLLKDNGTDLRENFKRLAIEKDLKEGELSQSDIAKKYGCSRQYVNDIKKKMGGKENERFNGKS